MFMSSDEAGAARRAITWADSGGSVASADRPLPHGTVTGIDVRSLPDGTEVVVDTHNSRYHLSMLKGNGSNARIQGGPYFREETDARIEGSALGGSLLKIGWIGIGLFMEIADGDRRIVTSRVRAIVVEPPSGLKHPGPIGSVAPRRCARTRG